MCLGEKRTTNHRRVDRLEFVVHIGFSPISLSLPPVLLCSRYNGNCSANGFSLTPLRNQLYVTCVFCLSFLKYLCTWLRYRVRLGFDSRLGHRFWSSHPYILPLGLADPPVRWEHRTLGGVRQPERGANHSPAPSECREEECVDLHRVHCVGLVRRCAYIPLPSVLLTWWCFHIPNCIVVTSTWEGGEKYSCFVVFVQQASTVGRVIAI
jgi:hypothetical protein